MNESTPPGALHAVGLGPGDPELVTIKAARLLRTAAVVFAPVARSGSTSLARQIALPWLDPAQQTIIELPFPVGADRRDWRATWAAAADTVGEWLRRVDTAAFITEGDPSLYSTFQYLRQALLARWPALRIEVVPGISAAFAAAAAIGAPLALDDESVAIVPATAGQPALRQALLNHATVAVYKVSAAWPETVATLNELDLLGAAVWARRVGQPEFELVRDIASLRDARPEYFSLLLVQNPRLRPKGDASSDE